MDEQCTQYNPDKTKQCVRCGYCCKKATCDIGVAHGALPTFSSKSFDTGFCKFLVGDAPGNYSCQLASKENLREDLGIGTGCSSSLFNEDREIAMKNKKIEVKMKKIITLNIIQIDEGSELIETAFLISSDELNDSEKNQMHEDAHLEFDELMSINTLPIHIKESVVEKFKEMEIW